MSASNAWLRAQRKSDLIIIAEHVGLKNYDGLKKDLELSLDEHLAANLDRYAEDPKLAPYFQSRNRSIGSPIKREPPEFKLPKRRLTAKPDAQVVSIPAPPAPSSPLDHFKVPEDEHQLPDPVEDDDDDGVDSVPDEEPAVAVTTSALVHTPARAASLSQRIPLPATPAEVAQVVDRGTAVVRRRMSSLAARNALPEYARATRRSLSSVAAVLLSVHLFELYFLRRELLADRYAFTIPALPALGTADRPVHVPDLFLLLTASFWRPAAAWLATSFVLPALGGWLVNLDAAAAASSSSSSSGPRPDHHPHEGRPVDPLTYSVVKAVLTYVVYGQGASFGGLVDPQSVARINSALYGGWKGSLVGCAITGLLAVYDAVLRK